MFCREQIAQLRGFPDLNIAFVSMGTPAEAADYRAQQRSPHLFICDPDRALYNEFALPQGSFTQLFNPTTFARGVRAATRGYGLGKPVGDTRQLGATFVIDTSGEVIWEYRAKHAADAPDPGLLVEKLRTVDAKV